MVDKSFHFVIVGAGAAGCVLAARLTEAPENEVLLIEAGPDAPPGEEHADIRDPFPVSLGNPRFYWPDLLAEVGVDPGNGGARAVRHYLQGYGVGGGSSINGMIAFRGQPGDYEAWRNEGAAGWGWDEVLPYFRKLERDCDFGGSLHGDSGPIPVRRVLPRDWAPFSKAMAAAIRRRGYLLLEDYNADFRDGLSSLPMSNLPDRRVSASAYLSQSVRQRANLTILANTFVERLDICAGRVRGVVARAGAQVLDLRARETIVSCGALYSPALLMRSGLGPASHLRELGIDVVRDIPGIGRNLQNHPKLELAVHLPGTSVQPRGQQGVGQNCLRYSSSVAGCADHDMGIVSLNRTSWHPIGRRVGAVGVALYQPFSQGTVTLASARPTVPPRVRFNLLADGRDFERMVRGARMALELLADEEVANARNDVFLPNGKIVHRLNERTSWNRLQSLAIAYALGVPAVRRVLLKNSKLDLTVPAGNETALRDLVRTRTGLSHHVCGTCKIGRADDPDAVVDEECRVRDVGSLRVIDASVFPTIVRGGMHLPVLMAAEKMADRIKAARGASR